MNVGYYCSKIGILKIVANDDSIISIGFVDQANIKYAEGMIKRDFNLNEKENEKEKEKIANSVVNECIRQLEQYFNGERFNFDIKYAINGTAFEMSIWQKLIAIPYGKTISYLDVAKSINNDKAVRAVGKAIGKNPLAIIIPCHRVVASDGKLTGYAYGVERKKYLLLHEKNNVERNINI